MVFEYHKNPTDTSFNKKEIWSRAKLEGISAQMNRIFKVLQERLPENGFWRAKLLSESDTRAELASQVRSRPFPRILCATTVEDDANGGFGEHASG